MVNGGERELIPDLDELPFPARHLFDLKSYPLYAPTGEQMLTVLTSRGCPYKCSFCFKGIVGRTYRQRSPENIVAELRELIDRYGVRNFYFMDDLFTINVKRLEAILDYFIAQDLDVRWRCLARVDRVTPELLRKMYQSRLPTDPFRYRIRQPGNLAEDGQTYQPGPGAPGDRVDRRRRHHE